MVDTYMKRQNAMQKEFFREIRKGLGRFLSILFIVALGTAFFSGIRSTESAMKQTGDAYFDNTALMDIKVVSTLGLTGEDVQALEELALVKRAVGSYSVDVLHTTQEYKEVLHIMAFMEEMNGYVLTQGEMPSEPDECLLDYNYARYNALEIGDTITLQSGTETDLLETLKRTTYTITGFANTPQYMSFQRGNTNIGNGEVGGFMVVAPQEFVKADIYTEIYIHVEGAKEETAYSARYEELLQQGMDEIGEIEDERREARRAEIVKEAELELAKAREEYQEEKAKVEQELADAFAKIQEAQQELADGRVQVANGERALQGAREQLHAKQKEVDTGWREYHTGVAELEQAKQEYDAGYIMYENEYALAMPKIVEGEESLKQGRAQLQEERNQFEESKAFLTDEQIVMYEEELAVAERALQVGEEEARVGRNALEDGRNQLLYAKRQLKEGEEKLALAQTQLTDGQKQIDSAWGQLAREERNLANAKQQIADGELELQEGKQTYEDGRKEAEAEFAKAEKELEEAEQEIAEIEKPKWYVADRDVLSEYTSFGDNATRMQAIGRVFPVIFFMVAALISLTAMTRMVEEQRMQIGTLKALGYGKFTIAMKYICYALLATIFGSALGVLIGGKLFPFVIISAYTSLYDGLTEIIVPYHVPYALWASAIAIACTLGATLIATYKELAVQPATLMRPPSPKMGKRVFLERITFIWKRLNFTWKSTVRNLVRYKKRFMMTILGIGACMGLMLIGFGLRDSILDIGRLQFKELEHAKATLYLQEDLLEEERQVILSEVEKQEDVSHFMEFYMRTSTLAHEKIEEDVYLMVPKSREDMPIFYSFRDRISKKVYELDDDGVILTEKIAKTLGVQVGDNLELQLSDYEEKTVRVSAITENYLMHYVYVSPALYEQLYEMKPTYNIIQLNIKESKEEGEIFQIGESLLETENVQSVSYANTMMGSMDDVLSSLNLVLIILTASAGLLAFVVLYNLNTININERRRELATIKVLGFFDKEVSAYVFRENILLTILGMLAGCGFGKFLHYFVITTVEVELLMFGRNINAMSYLYSMAFTVIFSMLVNAAMYLKLKKIDMVESLKSAE